MGGVLWEKSKKQHQFEKETQRHLDTLYRVALQLARNREDAEDLVQETYLKAFKRFDQFRKGTNSKVWLLKILKNTYIDSYRKESRRSEYNEWSESSALFLTSDSEQAVRRSSSTSSGYHLGGAYGLLSLGFETPETEMVKKHFLEDMTNAIDKLPSEFKTVIVLSVIEGLSYEEIAQILNCPKGTVMSRLYRGRILLREQLKDYTSRLLEKETMIFSEY